MKTLMLTFISLTMLLTISCSKDLETTGRAIISFDNQALFNQTNFFVDAAIVLQESDISELEDFGRSDISQGGSVEFSPVELNVGNYYVRYRYFSGNMPSSNVLHRPFQIRPGEDSVIEIIR